MVIYVLNTFNSIFCDCKRYLLIKLYGTSLSVNVIFINAAFRLILFSRLQSLAIPDCSEECSHFSFSFLALTHFLYIPAVALSHKCDAVLYWLPYR